MHPPSWLHATITPPVYILSNHCLLKTIAKPAFVISFSARPLSGTTPVHAPSGTGYENRNA